MNFYPSKTCNFNFEYKNKINLGYVGCGEHSYRNILPALKYLPVELQAICDHSYKRAQIYSQSFGFKRAYDDLEKMLKKEYLDMVIVVTNSDEQGRPRYPIIASKAMKSGCHVWVEKPPADSLEDINMIKKVSYDSGKFFMVGFKHCFFPTTVQAKKIMESKLFGSSSSIYSRYHTVLPSYSRRKSLINMRKFLDIVHPISLITYLMGKVKRLFFFETFDELGVTINFEFISGSIGTLHLTGGQSKSCPPQRTEIIGNGANIIIENNSKLFYYPPTTEKEYGRSVSYFTDLKEGPRIWEPEFTQGQLYNNSLFLQGYVQEINYFLNCIRKKRRPIIAGIEHAEHVTKIYQAFQNLSGRVINIC